MTNTPLVSVIALCYNHARFVEEALVSVFNQTYPNIELIVIDDASTDGSQACISTCIDQYSTSQVSVLFLPLSKNHGNCVAFNCALAQAQGKYVIDFATDDVLHPQRIQKQVMVFEKLSSDYAVVFGDVLFVQEDGTPIKTHYARTTDNQLKVSVPSGDIYQHVLKSGNFVSTPSIMIRKSVLDTLGGYDESLSYEDYDFFIRSGRNYLYYFQDEVLTYKRSTKQSLGKQFYNKKNNKHLESTLKVCRKAQKLNRNSCENQALAQSVRFHWRLAIFTQNFKLAKGYYKLLIELDALTLKDYFLYCLMVSKLPFYLVYQPYLRYWRRL